MTVAPGPLSILVSIALAATALSPIVLVALLIRDIREKSLW